MSNLEIYFMQYHLKQTNSLLQNMVNDTSCGRLKETEISNNYWSIQSKEGEVVLVNLAVLLIPLLNGNL